MIIYLIGPSGAGKSTIAAGAVLERSYIRHVDLDLVIQARDCQLFCHDGSRWEEFWALASACCSELETGFKGITLVDCGAGCLITPNAFSFFQSAGFVVAFIGRPEFLFERAQKSRPYWSNRTPKEYEESELSAHRQKFYDAAKFKIDVSSLTVHQGIAQLLAILNKASRVNAAT